MAGNYRETAPSVRWEYKMYRPKLTTFTAKMDDDAYVADLDELGAEGWEVVAVTAYQDIFVTLKRPVAGG